VGLANTLKSSCLAGSRQRNSHPCRKKNGQKNAKMKTVRQAAGSDGAAAQSQPHGGSSMADVAAPST